jgi:hypothetical protein
VRLVVRAAAIVLGAAQIAGAANPSINETVIDASGERFFLCAQQTVPNFDDGRTPVGVVARVVANECIFEASTWAGEMRKVMSNDDAARIFQEAMRGDNARLIGIVLRHRVSKR